MLYRSWMMILFIFFCGTNLNAQVEIAPKYNLKDLEVLERENNPEEFLAHVNDIRPSERSKLWKKMYDNMACALIEKRIKAKDFSKKTFAEIETYAKSSVLHNEEIFQFKRNLYVKNYFKECYLTTLDKLTCDKELENFWESSNRDPDIALFLLKYLEEYDSKLDTWPYYQTIISDSVAPIYCKKAEIKRAILKKLNELTFKEEFDGDYKKLIQKNIPHSCFVELYPTLTEALTSNLTKGLDKEQALNLLEASDQIKKEDRNFYLILYMMDAPVVGQQLNRAWSLTQNLAENAKERALIINKIKNLELIPDKTFYDPKSTRNKAIINILARNFPELLNYYADNCIRFLNGKENTHVSSSFQCHQFLSSSKEFHETEKSNWISDSLRIEYSAIKK